MFVLLLKFSENKDRAAAFMQGHKDWIKRGFDEGVFLLAGSLQPAASQLGVSQPAASQLGAAQPAAGGCILAHGLSRAELDARAREDPFVAEKVVTAEIIEIAPAKVDPRVAFLLPAGA